MGHPDAEAALALAMEAAEAIESAGRTFGLMSLESRLARAAYDHLMGDYLDIVGEEEMD